MRGWEGHNCHEEIKVHGVAVRVCFEAGGTRVAVEVCRIKPIRGHNGRGINLLPIDLTTHPVAIGVSVKRQEKTNHIIGFW
jgi:hypothetical protein